ncbi:MAG: prepilin-type N-terminal cleavage/methylation domain-containing protein [Patescibacteria group bacterium]
MKFSRKNGGYTLLELIVYVSVVALLAVISVQSTLSLTRTFSEAKSYGDIRESGTASLERIIKEIRFASSVNLPNTTLNSNPGRLTLNTTDELGNPKTVEFYVSDNSLRLIDGGVDKGAYRD